MPFTIERGDDPFLDELWDQAEQRGEKRGEQKGKLEGKVDFMRKSLELRFGTLPAWANERLSKATNDMLDSWLTCLYAANTIDDVFDPGR